MSLDHILLGMLNAPASGYDIKRGFNEGARHFWSAELSQIYPALKALEKRGWLTSRLEPPAKGPPRRVYRRTAQGRVAGGRVFGACAYAVALTALGSTSWALLHPSSWAGEPVSLGQVSADEIMFVAILGFLGLLLLHGVETGVRAMRTRRHPEQFAGWRLRLLSLAVPSAGLGLFVFGLFHLVQGSGGLFLIPVALGAAGIAGYFEDRRFLANPRPTPMAWWQRAQTVSQRVIESKLKLGMEWVAKVIGFL